MTHSFPGNGNGGPGPRLLLVDDDGDLLESMSRVIRNAGFDVRTACDAESAISSLEEHRPAVVLTDLRLPGRSGLDVLEQVRAMMPRVPVILMTAYGDDDCTHAAQLMGVFAMLIKPVFKEDLLGTVRRALAAGPPPLPTGPGAPGPRRGGGA